MIFWPDVRRGYRWYTVGCGRNTAGTAWWIWIKLGPLSGAYGNYGFDYPYRLELFWLGEPQARW